MNRIKSKKLEQLLATNEVARNGTSRELELEYILAYVCKNAFERNIIKKVLKRPRPSGASLKRQRAYYQNTLGLYEPEFEIKEVRTKQEVEMREKYSPINNLLQGIFRWFK